MRDFWHIAEVRSDLDKVAFAPVDGTREPARRLAAYVHKVTGARLRLCEVSRRAYPRAAFILGTEQQFLNWGLRRSRRLTQQDSFAIRGDPQRDLLALVGGSPRGVFYAVQETLERFFGVRWLTPWETYLPRKRDVRIGKCVRIESAPAFAFRGHHICYSGRDRRGRIRLHYDEKILEWMRANRMNAKFVHNGELGDVEEDLHRLGITPLCLGDAFSDFCPASLFAEHPEYFPLINGRRVGDGVIKRCVSNPGFQRHFIGQVLAFLKEHPDVNEVSIQPSDGLGWCECDECRAMDTAEDAARGTVSGRVFKFAALVAKAVAKEFPEKKIALASYSNWSEPPRGMRRTPNLAVAVTTWRSYSRSLDDPRSACNRPIWQRLRKFARVAGRTMVYEYGYMRDMPFPVCEVQSRTLDALHALGVDTYFCETWPSRDHWDIVMLPLYFFARKTWDISLRAEDCIRDFCQHYYGRAAGPMTDYFLTLERAFQGGMQEYLFSDAQSAVHFFTPEVEARCQALLAAAHASLGLRDARLRRRVETQKRLVGIWAEACRRLRERDLGPTEISCPRLRSGKNPWAQLLRVSKPTPLLQRAVLRTLGHVRVGHDGENVYLLFRCFEPDVERLKRTAESHWPFSTSHVDFYLCPRPRTGWYYQFVVNARDAYVVRRCRENWDSSYKATIRTKTSFGRDSWWAKIVIPAVAVEETGILRGGPRIRSPRRWKAALNLHQEWYNDGHVAGWPAGGAHHNVEQFGWLKFTPTPAVAADKAHARGTP